MTQRFGRSASALLIGALLFPTADGRGEDPPTTLPAQPVRDSIDPIVAKIERERTEPCYKADEAGVPCYPTSTEAHGPVYSVRDSLGVPPERTTGGRALPKGFGPAGIAIPFDPVCIAKSAIKALKGKNDVYYLYRVRLPQGDHVEMREERLDPKAFQGNVEFLGRFSGECEALAAYHREDRRPSPTRNAIEATGPPTR